MNPLRLGVFCWATLLIAQIGSPACADEKPADQFAGFPEINKFRRGERSVKVITSDGVTGLVRPKWTRAMSDLGGWPAMHRFKGTIYFVFPHVDGHRYNRFEATGKHFVYASKDEGKTWTLQPHPTFTFTPEYVVAGDTLYAFDARKDIPQPQVRTSTDGIKWSEPTNIYKKPFYFWGVMYDPASKMFWAPPHAIPKTKDDGPRQIHLVSSKDGINWDHISVVAPFTNASESVLLFDEDRTMTVLIRRKYGRTSNVAVAKPPYKEWTVTERPVIIEGEHLFQIGGETFLASRANYSGNNADIKANPKIFDGRKSYSMVYRVTKERQLEPWAVMDSMGDCSYPFLVETPTEILCAYYSQHEDRVCKPYLCAFDKKEFLKGPEGVK